MLKGKKLLKFVDGTNSCDPKFKVDANGQDTIEVDPKFEDLHAQDQAVYH